MVEHDNSYKLLFSHAEMVRGLLLGFVEEEWVRKLDLESLERVSGSYVVANSTSLSDFAWVEFPFTPSCASEVPGCSGDIQTLVYRP